MIYTMVVYGYQLGGPGQWNLRGFAAGDELRAPWYDERNPAHDFPERAIGAIAGVAGDTTDNRARRREREAGLPFMFEEATELSPPGWTREASAPPSPVGLSPQSHPVPAADVATNPRFVLFVNDSAVHVEENHGYHGPHEHEIEAWDHRVDWDSLLDAALAELGLQAPGMPDWFWYRAGTPD